MLSDDIGNFIQQEQIMSQFFSVNRGTGYAGHDVQQLAAAVRELGGVGVLRDAITVQTQQMQQTKVGLVAAITANSRNAFPKAVLNTMSLDQLQYLYRSLAPVDYGARAGVPFSAYQGTGAEWLPYEMPTVDDSPSAVQPKLPANPRLQFSHAQDNGAWELYES
jgi:hypothetical protein